ncbi:RILP-like protein 1 isoform X2 [Neolamprologus brichardi]|uniref:RILP-like protein 1 isoform X2 n=1 Tax=Neolamprologus brichardi TaxID=32507 RepID=UPI001643DF4D|nr:RILP-like protein 1 isoform X2 [Neolamprologus brichardi]
MENRAVSVLDKPAAVLTVVDVYEIAAVLGQEFERMIDKFGCDALVALVPRVVRVLELLEALVSRGATGQEAEDLRRELDRLRQERRDRHEQERKHQKELELLEDVWRGEVQDLLSQITQLQAENKRLLVSLSLKETPVTEEDLQKHEGMSEKEKQVMKKLQDLVDKQRDDIRAKDHELTLKNEDIEALQLQQHRLIRMNQELLHRIGLMEAQGKTLIQQRAELEAAAQAQHQEAGALRLEVTRLKKELRELERETEVAQIEELPLSNSEISSPASPLMTSAAAAHLSSSFKPNSVWVECGGDPDFLENCFECDKSLSFVRKSANREDNKEDGDEEENSTTLLLNGSTDEEPEEDSDKPRFTLQELRDVLQEKNELKAQVFLLQEELAYYKSDELNTEENTGSTVSSPSPPPSLPVADQRESGIRRLIFTAIMPMVAAGLITDDPTLLPIRRLSFV